MSNDEPLDKDRLFFTQCYDNFYLRCPVCTQSKKTLRHCRILKSLGALGFHLTREHSDIPESIREEINRVLNSVFQGFKWQMFPKWVYSEEPEPITTTSSSFLIDGHAPRADQWEKIQKIATLLRNQSTFYPNYKKDKLLIFVKMAAGVYDKRTIEQYFDIVVSYSNKDKIRGIYDVTGFCNTVAP